MRLNLSADEVLTTTRAVRKRLDFERPVEREVVEACVRIAQQAPSGSNGQGFHFVFVTDPAKKQGLAELYRRTAEPYLASAAMDAHGEGDPRTERSTAVRSSAQYLSDRMQDVPLLMVPCYEGRLPDGTPGWMHAGYWGSLLPAVWSFMLAARERGLGTAWTSLHLPFEREAADLLGIPYDSVSQGGLIPVAYTKGTDFKPASRLPLARVVHWDTW